MKDKITIKSVVLVLLVFSCLQVVASDTGFQGWLFDADDLETVNLTELKQHSVKQLVVSIQQPPEAQQLIELNRFKESGLRIWYWIEVARDVELATAHPEWMASIQGHPEWRRFYPNFPKERDDQMVKVFPWVPIFYQKAFEAQISKVQQLLQVWPSAKGVILNDLQGAPSACGCGHPLCRWTTDYGPKRTAARLEHDAPARFVQKVKSLFPKLECIPVWASECEAHDKDGWCAGVGCYGGACWREWSRQLEPLTEQSPTFGALLTYKDLGRDLDHYTEEAGWVSSAIGSFQAEMQRYKRPGIAANRLIAVLQGWDVSEGEVAAQIKQSGQAGSGGYIIAKTPILSEWKPKLVSLEISQ